MRKTKQTHKCSLYLLNHELTSVAWSLFSAPDLWSWSDYRNSLEISRVETSAGKSGAVSSNLFGLLFILLKMLFKHFNINNQRSIQRVGRFLIGSGSSCFPSALKKVTHISLCVQTFFIHYNQVTYKGNKYSHIQVISVLHNETLIFSLLRHQKNQNDPKSPRTKSPAFPNVSFIPTLWMNVAIAAFPSRWRKTVT